MHPEDRDGPKAAWLLLSAQVVSQQGSSARVTRSGENKRVTPCYHP